MKAFKLGFVLAAVLVLAGRAPGAWACSCVAAPDDESYWLEHATLAWEGVVVSGEPASEPVQGEPSGLGVTKWTFDVDRTLKGDVKDPQIAYAGSQGDTCGYHFTIGRRYRVHAYTDHEKKPSTGLCSGNVDLGPAPAASPSPASTPATLAADQKDSPEEGAGMAIALGAVTVVTVGGALALARRRP